MAKKKTTATPQDLKSRILAELATAKQDPHAALARIRKIVKES